MVNSVPWTTAQATENIRKVAASSDLTITYKIHAKEQMSDRGLIISDVLYVLKNGFVYNEPEPSTRSGYFKYAIESSCPNSARRVVRVIVIPESKSNFLKIITVMWVDK